METSSSTSENASENLPRDGQKFAPEEDSLVPQNDVKKIDENIFSKIICWTFKIENYQITQFYITLIVAFVSSRVGFTSAFTSPAEEGLKNDFKITQYQYSWLGSVMPLIALIGGVIGGISISRKGRKFTIIVANAIFTISWLIMALANSAWWIFIARSVVGVGVGITSLTLPVYLAEILEPEVRGKFGLFPTAFGNGGILLCFILGNFFAWRSLAWFGIFCSAPFLFYTYRYLEETPNYYVSANKEKEAEDVLKTIRKNHNTVDELETLRKNAAEQKLLQKKHRLRDVFKPQYRPAIMISLLLMLFQQLSGINAIIYYSNNIFKSANSSIEEKYCTIAIGVVNFVSAFIAAGIIDKLGRKKLLYISGSSLVVTLSVLSVYFYFKDGALAQYGWIPLGSLVVYVLGFSLGFGPIPWLMMGEILPREIRAEAATISTGFNWLCTFFVTKVFYTAMEFVPIWVIFLVFCVICACSLVYIRLKVPETSGRTLEEIEDALSGRTTTQNAV